MELTDPAALASSFQYYDHNFGFGTNIGDTVLSPNPHRVAILVSGTSGSFSMRPLSVPSSNMGLTFSFPAGGPAVLKFADLGGVITFQWVCTGTPSGVVTVAEIIYYPLE